MKIFAFILCLYIVATTSLALARNQKGGYGSDFTSDDESACEVATTDGGCCVFPFIYNKKSYKSCTSIVSGGFPWCSKTSNYDNDSRWGYCKISEVDQCESSPCQNGGLCASQGSTYTCDCANTGYEGTNCETKQWCSTKLIKQGCFESVGTHGKYLASWRNDINWSTGWNDFIKKAICDCSKLAIYGHYEYFYIEFYGECWGVNHSPHVVGLPENPKKCVGEGKTAGFVCKDNSSSTSLPPCVGKGHAGFFYSYM